MKRLAIIALFALSISVSNAEELTFEQCLTLAKENNLKIRAAEHQIAAAKHEFTSARALFFPNISMTGSAIYSSADGDFSIDEFNLPVLNNTGQYTGDFVHVPSI
ncbi:MAG: TolC family protein, partial [Muribaculaceae bacterium]